MKRLYKIQSTFYALLDDDEDIESSAHLVTGTLEPDTTDLTVEFATELEPGWADSIPYGDADDQTCAWWLGAQSDGKE